MLIDAAGAVGNRLAGTTDTRIHSSKSRSLNAASLNLTFEAQSIQPEGAWWALRNMNNQTCQQTARDPILPFRQDRFDWRQNETSPTREYSALRANDVTERR
jgi:hypothetical protein